MNLLVVSHKICWPSSKNTSNYVTNGGFPLQMAALSELFHTTTLLVPCKTATPPEGMMPLVGQNLRILPLTPVPGSGWLRKLLLPFWVLRNSSRILKAMFHTDAVHIPIPGDVGTIGLIYALMLRKRLFVRHCGNWKVQRTYAEILWRWIMEKFATKERVMLATGGDHENPSVINPFIQWIFSSSLTEAELHACSIQAAVTISQRPSRLIIVCRQEYGKGTETVIQALALLPDPELHLDIVGNGQQLPSLQVLACDLEVADRITFHGSAVHKYVLKLLLAADIFCYPTRAYEGFPKVVVEALACGLPVITTAVSVLPHIINQGCGLLIPASDPVALAAAIQSCRDTPATFQAMARQAPIVAAQYSLERWRDDIGQYLRQGWGQW